MKNFNDKIIHSSIALPYFVLVMCTIYLIYLVSQIIVPVDSGDGLQHYFIAKASLNNPKLLLNHWGKPFFTTIMSPFTAFGFKGIVSVNIFLFILLNLIAFRFLTKLKVNPFLQVFLPIIFIQIPDFLYVCCGGLTELLFAFLAVCGGYALYLKKYTWFAISSSLLPFCRSEGQLVFLLALIILLMFREWKSILVLFIIPIVYSFLGYFLLEDFLWYFNTNPYPKISPYGHGPLDHFWTNRQSYLGKLGFVVVCIAVASLFTPWFWKQSKSMPFWVIAFGLTTFFGILACHSYFWYKGTNGSAGLTRVIIQGVPLFFIICLVFIQPVFDKFHLFIQLTGFIAIFFATCNYMYSHNLDVQFGGSVFAVAIYKSGKYIKEHKTKSQTVYYHHPLIGYAGNSSTMQNNNGFRFTYFSIVSKDIENMKSGDYIVRDPHFGPLEAGLPMDSLKNNLNIKLIKTFTSAWQPKGLKDPWTTYIYQKK